MIIRRDAGFTLIELSIVLIVMGLMMAALFSGMKARMAMRDHKTTVASLQTANAALKSYLAMNGAYPCPASRLAPRDTPGYGKALENCRTEKNLPSSLSTKPQETIAVAGREKRMVRIGLLPFRSLGISDMTATDGWGNLLLYAVTEPLTTPQLYDQDKGAIDVIAEDRQSRVKPAGSVQYVVFSTGPDGLRGWSAGGNPTGLPCPDKTLQAENCNDDAVFMDTESRYDNGKTVFDDILSYHQYDPGKADTGGVVLYYMGSCPADFVKMDVGDRYVGGVETLVSKERWEKDEHSSRREEDKKVICYSPRYTSTIMIGSEERDEKFSCPDGWDSIGYRASGGDAGDPDGIDYQFCAR